MPKSPPLPFLPHSPLFGLPHTSLPAALCLALGGGSAAAVGLVAYPWQHFTWAQLTTPAALHVSGQVAIGFTLAAGFALWASWPAHRAHWRWPALIATWLNVAALLVAPTVAASGLTLNDIEAVHLASGHSLALVGALAMACAATWLAGQEALPTTAEPWVQIAVLWDGQPVAHHALPPGRAIRVGHAVGARDVDLPTTRCPRSVVLVEPRDGVPSLIPPARGRTLHDGRCVEHQDPIALSSWRPILVEFDRVGLSCTLEPMPEPLPGGIGFDERLIAAIAVSAALQLLIITYAALS